MIYLKNISMFRNSSKHVRQLDKAEAEDSDLSMQLRQEFINLALRDAIIRHSIPRNWVNAALVAVTVGERERWDVRLEILESEALLWRHATEFRATFIRRLRLLDSQWRKWVSEICWKFPEMKVQLSSVDETSQAVTNFNAPAIGNLSADNHVVDTSSTSAMQPNTTAQSESKVAPTTPQDVQLQKLREVMAQGDAILEHREFAGELVDFQETRPLEPVA